MQKRVLTLVFVLLLPALCIAQKADYRGFSWGDSMEKVKQLEGTERMNEGKDLLYYDNKQLGDRTTIGLYYHFKDNKLTSIVWQLNQDSYKQLFADLSQKYGTPFFLPLTIINGRLNGQK